MQLTLSQPHAPGEPLLNWDARSLPAIDIPGLYVHIPFCFHKCHYCDFYSITGQAPERMDRFVDLILREADGWAPGRRGPTIRPESVFFGGGTPSLLPRPFMERLLQGLRSRFDLSAVSEWTVECNPATVDLEYCQMLRGCGLNRLSFGAQSFDRDQLKTLERHHDPDDVARSIDIARRAGFERLNLDLIYAIPGQSLESWDESLSAALALSPEHLSCYGLTYEPNTPIAVRKRLGQLEPSEEQLELEMLHRTRRRLAAAGLPAYEISNYARPGAECRHNLLYWNGGSYVGLGPSAASHVDGWRWRNRPHLGEWEQSVASGAVPTADAEHLTPAQRAGELAMLRLRLSEGIIFRDFERWSGVDARRHFADVIDQLLKLKLVEIDERALRLTETGLNVADAVAAEFVAGDHTASN